MCYACQTEAKRIVLLLYTYFSCQLLRGPWVLHPWPGPGLLDFLLIIFAPVAISFPTFQRSSVCATCGLARSSFWNSGGLLIELGLSLQAEAWPIVQGTCTPSEVKKKVSQKGKKKENTKIARKIYDLTRYANKRVLPALERRLVRERGSPISCVRFAWRWCHGKRTRLIRGGQPISGRAFPRDG